MNEHIELVVAIKEADRDAQRLYNSMKTYGKFMFPTGDNHGYKEFLRMLENIREIMDQFSGDYLNQSEIAVHNISIEAREEVDRDQWGILKVGETYFDELTQSPIKILSLVFIGTDEPWVTYCVKDYNTLVEIYGSSWASQVEKWIRR